MSLGGRLAALSMLAVLVGLLVGGFAALTVYRLGERHQADLELGRLSEQTLEMAELHETLKAAVYARHVGLITPPALADAEAHAQALQQVTFGFAAGDDGEALRQLGEQAYAVAVQANDLLTAPRPPSRAQLVTFHVEADALGERVHAEHELLTAERDRRQAAGRGALSRALSLLGGLVAALCVLLFATGWLIRRQLLASLRELAVVARAVAGGDLSARAAFDGQDEVAELARVLDQTSASLQQAFAELDADALRQDFRARLDRALAQADTDSELTATVRRALALLAPDRAVELLTADSSEAHLEALASTPGIAAPRCTVPTPWSCPAIRAGRTVVYPSSDVLDACSHLRGRTAGDRSAVCIPVSFMGRATGVLHATAAPGELPDDEELARLQMVAEQTGVRLGALRALEQVQRQATLDGLTGLPNRRSFEDAVRSLRARQIRYGVLLADLDHFKSVNDTFGHATGDVALRRFAEVLRSCLRDIDLPCRHGGEEFAIVLPDADAETAAEVAERLRAALAEAGKEQDGPTVTVSVGVADSTMADSLDEQLALADEALLAAKRAGRNRCRIASRSDSVEYEGEPPGLRASLAEAAH